MVFDGVKTTDPCLRAQPSAAASSYSLIPQGWSLLNINHCLSFLLIPCLVNCRSLSFPYPNAPGRLECIISQRTEATSPLAVSFPLPCIDDNTMPLQDPWILPRYPTMADPFGEPCTSTVGDVHIEVEDANMELANVRQTLDRLRKWHNWGVRSRQSLKWYLWSRIYHKRPPCPSHDQLRQLALFFFPPRATAVKVEICDYGDGRFRRYDTTVDNLVPCQSRWSSAHFIRSCADRRQISKPSLTG